MNARPLPLLFTSLLLGGLALAPGALASGDRETARVSVVEGSLYARGPFDEDSEELVTNAVLRPGDEIFTAEGTFAELELPDETFVRIASGTTFVLQRMDDEAVELALGDGALYVSLGAGALPCSIETFGGSVVPRKRAMVRVGNDAERTSLFIVAARGEADLVANGESTPVETGRTLAWTADSLDREAFEVNRGDAFDRWNAQREDIVRGVGRHPSLGPGMVGAHELEGSGTWLLIDNTWAWRPSGVAVGWRPYSNGTWSWYEPYGWTWVSYERWGYTTSHYGRWIWQGRHGWCWYPAQTWGAAWVVWAVFGGNVGWAPCDFRGRPVCTTVTYRNYDRHSWSYCESDYFHRGGSRRNCHDCRPVRRTPSHGRPYRHDGFRPAPAPGAGPGSDGPRIRQFERDPTSLHAPVPVRDVRRDLAPRHAPRLTDPDRRMTVTPPAHRPVTLLDRSVEDPRRVRPEPWNDPRVNDRARRVPGTGTGSGSGAPLPPPAEPARDETSTARRPTILDRGHRLPDDAGTLPREAPTTPTSRVRTLPTTRTPEHARPPDATRRDPLPRGETLAPAHPPHGTRNPAPLEGSDTRRMPTRVHPALPSAPQPRAVPPSMPPRSQAPVAQPGHAARPTSPPPTPPTRRDPPPPPAPVPATPQPAPSPTREQRPSASAPAPAPREGTSGRSHGSSRSGSDKRRSDDAGRSQRGGRG